MLRDLFEPFVTEFESTTVYERIYIKYMYMLKLYIVHCLMSRLNQVRIRNSFLKGRGVQARIQEFMYWQGPPLDMLLS